MKDVGLNVCKLQKKSSKSNYFCFIFNDFAALEKKLQTLLLGNVQILNLEHKVLKNNCRENQIISLNWIILSSHI